ncbi:MAG TPA: glutathione S-transferase family protein [Stellaceae bacterium]|jgi:glutathione S-transferase|nr:glutathione S-transferase family protein [Stellaceae bacterium]
MDEGFILYGSPHSQYTYKLALTLRLAGQAFSFRYISFQKGMQRTAEFRALSRWGQVPVLKHRDAVLVQSGAILEYLADTLDRFGGSDHHARRRVREWLYWDADRFASPIYGCYGVALGERGLLPIKVDPIVAAYHRQGAQAAFASLEAQLGNRDFLAAPELTIADVCCYGETAFARMSGFDLAPWPEVARWAARIEAQPRFKPPLELLPMADAEIAAA